MVHEGVEGDEANVNGQRLHLDAEHRKHILTEHPEVRPYLKRLGEVFRSPDWVKRSRRDPNVLEPVS